LIVGKSEVKRPLGSGWDDNIKTDLKGHGCDDVGWIHLARTESSGVPL